uniref:hypothetical protein n=1 Tax=Chrysotila carterae TaxID=13221 RepID=UPI0022F2C72B|nr:hypothetical protein PKF17_pgp025 [Chrysotila carterae]WAK83224.1 hypothetical protein [Chrysotila carterae]
MPCYSCKLNLFYGISQVTRTSLGLEKYSGLIDYLDYLISCNILPIFFSFFWSNVNGIIIVFYLVK